MKSRLGILHLEDNLRDAELVEETLATDGIACDVVRVETEADFVASLEQSCFDLIFADYTLPSFDGLSALKIARQDWPHIPFIFVSGTLGEEVAIEALKNGATDYVFKTRLSRIVPSVRRALREADERRGLSYTQEALRRSEAYLAEAQRLSHTGSFGWNVSSGEIYWSRETFRIMGYEPSVRPSLELVLERTHPNDKPAVLQLVDRASREMKDFDFEHRLLMTDGSVKHVRIVARATRDEMSNLEFVGAVLDVTAARIAEARIRQDEMELRLIVDTIPGFVWTMTTAGDVEMVNRQMLDYFGKTLEELRDPIPFVHPGDRERVIACWVNTIGSGQPFEVEHRLRRADGVYRWFQSRGRPLRDPEGRIRRWYNLMTDIEDKKQAEEALRASEENSRLIVDSVPGLVATLTAEGDLEFVNQQCLDYFGMTFDELKSWTTSDINHPADHSRVLATWRHSVETGQPFDSEHRIRRADGAYRWFHVRGHPRRDSEGRVIRWYLLLSDIDERKQAEEKLRRSEADLLDAQRLSHTGSYKHDVISGTVTSSPESYRTWGTSPDDDTSNLEFWLSRMHPEDRGRFRELYERCVAEKTAYEADFRIVLPDGTIKYQHSIGHPVLNELGDLVEYVGATTDITEQVTARAELERAFEEIKRLKDRLQDENLALRDEVVRASMFEEIVGTSLPLQAVLARVAKVAPTDSTVLISGETGTGKELFARAIHKRSPRSSRAFVSVNCAAIPSTLIASELFGHEKGAFTGALQRRLGRFELAEGGTIFLDEIGELPLETQVALLRVLQEREFERVGGSQVIRADVRVIAATNRDLESAIAGAAFRKDLFYRLNVFPIEIPPLRERREDIPTLVEYFVHRYSRKVGKKIRAIEKKTLELLQSYTWPGNIRELQNVIERSVIFCETDLFVVDPSWLSFQSSATPADGPLTKMSPAQEREAIEKALAATAGRVSGPSGAAAQLSIPASTLESKIRSLKINKFRFKKI